MPRLKYNHHHKFHDADWNDEYIPSNELDELSKLISENSKLKENKDRFNESYSR